MILHPESTLPTFYATDLRRLPAIDATHCDVSAIVFELQALRAEMRSLGSLREDVGANFFTKSKICELRRQIASICTSRPVPKDEDELNMLNDIHERFCAIGRPAVDLTRGILVGRPYGGRFSIGALTCLQSCYHRCLKMFF